MYSPAACIATAVVLPVLNIFLVCLRYWVRLSFKRTYIGADDILIVFGVFFVVGMAIIQIAATVLGDYSEETEATLRRNDIEVKMQYATVIVEKLACGFIKLSVLFFYRRIFSVRRGFRVFNTTMIFLSLGWMIGYILSEVFECGTNFSLQWRSREEAQEKCDNHGLDLLLFAITDLVGDVLIVTMPFYCIRDLHMNRRAKLGVGVIFLFGTLSTMAVALRIGFVIKAFTIGQLQWVPPPERKPAIGGLRVINPSFWTLVEVTTGAIAACLPPLGPLLRRTPTLSRIVSYTRRKLSLSPKQTNDENTHGLTESPHLENGQWGKRLQHEESWSTRSTETRSSRPETAISPLPQVPPERSPTRVSSLMAKDESRIGVAM